jgi:hypothetical protein
MRFDVRRIDHLCVGGSSVPSKLPEQILPDAPPRPTHKAIIDRCRRTILRRAIAPATAALQYMYDTADDPAIICPLHTPYIRRQMRFYPLPLLIAEPKQVPAHGSISQKRNHAVWNQDCLSLAAELMSSHPNQRLAKVPVPLLQFPSHGHVIRNRGTTKTPETKNDSLPPFSPQHSLVAAVSVVASCEFRHTGARSDLHFILRESPSELVP